MPLDFVWSASGTYHRQYIIREKSRDAPSFFKIVIVRHKHWGRIWSCVRNESLSLQKNKDILEIRLAQAVGESVRYTKG